MGVELRERENDVECWELKKWVLKVIEWYKPLQMVLGAFV